MSRVRGKQGSIYVKSTHAGVLSSIENCIEDWSFDQAADSVSTTTLSQYASLIGTKDTTMVNFSGSMSGFMEADQVDKIEIGSKVFMKLVLDPSVVASITDTVSVEVAAGLNEFVLGSGAVAPVAGQKVTFSGHNRVYTVDSYTAGTKTVALTENLEAEITAAEVVKFAGGGRYYYGAFTITSYNDSANVGDFVKFSANFENNALVFKNNDALDPNDLANSQYALGNSSLY